MEKRRKFVNQLGKLLVETGAIYIREPTRKSHGISSEEIRKLILLEGFSEKNFREGYSFPLRGKVCAGIFAKLRHERFKYH